MDSMNFLLLTKYDGVFVGPFARILGYIMEFLYNAFSSIGIENIGLCIITFTIVVRCCLLPLTIKQQKFSKMQAVMNPELTALRKKYEGKRDNESIMRMNDEQKAIYQKYGVSASGSCLQMLIQFPIIIGLYRVIWSIPAYVPKVYDIYQGAAQFLADHGFVEISGKTATLLAEGGTAAEATTQNVNFVIDALSNGQIKWDAAIDMASKAGLSTDVLTNAMNRATDINGFFGINLGRSPMELMGFALLIPILAGVTQWISTRLMMANTSSGGEKGSVEEATTNSMKIMNNFMPIMSMVMCFMFQCGIGLYWISGSVFHIVSQLFTNMYFKKIDVDELIKKNLEKVNKKREKQGLPPQKITNNASVNARSISQQKTASKPAVTSNKKNVNASYNNKAKTGDENSQGMRTKGKPGSITEKANMVSSFNERNKK